MYVRVRVWQSRLFDSAFWALSPSHFRERKWYGLPAAVGVAVAAKRVISLKQGPAECQFHAKRFQFVVQISPMLGKFSEIDTI